MHISSISMDHPSNRDHQSEGHNDQQHFSYQQQPAAAGRGTYPITSSSPSSSAPFSTKFLGHDFLSPSCSNPDWFSTQATAEDNPCLYNFMEEKNNDDEVRRRREHQQQSSLSYYSSDQSSHHDLQTLAIERIQKEHMFDKVVTPSDVGKLNRLVIPKQHAERYFPLDLSANEKGLLLNFEDSTRKLWRFRYSYWNSSQSYVMTKGWSRFVKEKKLEAGDIVSFQRGVGEAASRDRLFIDWRRRPTSNNPLLFHHQPGSIIPSLSLPYHYFPFNQTRPATWGTTSTATPPLYLQPLVQLTSGHQFPQHNYRNLHFHSKSHHYNQYQQQLQQCSPYTNNNNGVISDPYRAAAVGSSSHTVWYLRSSADESPAGGNGEDSMVFDSVPRVHHPKAEGKKLRLFGVSMECENQPNTPAGSETLSSSPTPGAASSPSESPHFRSDDIFSDPSERRSKGIISLNLSF